jgi:hypothetical protein
VRAVRGLRCLRHARAVARAGGGASAQPGTRELRAGRRRRAARAGAAAVAHAGRDPAPATRNRRGRPGRRDGLLQAGAIAGALDSQPHEMP